MKQGDGPVFKTSYIRARRTPKGWCVSMQCYVYPKDLGDGGIKGLAFWLDKLTKNFALAWDWIEEDEKETKDA